MDLQLALEMLPYAPAIAALTIGLGKLVTYLLCEDTCSKKVHRAVPLILIILGTALGLIFRFEPLGAIEGMFGALMGMGLYSGAKHTAKNNS